MELIAYWFLASLLSGPFLGSFIAVGYKEE